MTPDYIELKNGRKVRIEYNMNSIAAFTAQTGMEPSELMGSKFDVYMLRTLSYLTAVEGERADGKELEMDEVTFGGYMSVPNVTQFVEIFRKQGGLAMSQKKSPKEMPWYNRMRKR